MMWYADGGMAWWGWLLMSLGMVAFWGFVIWAVWALLATGGRRPGDVRPPADARTILDERLARGEIDGEEYQRLRKLIEGGSPAARNGHSPVSTGDRVSSA